MTKESACKEKTALLASYQRATREYSDTVTELNRKMGTSSTAEFEKMRRSAEDTRMKAGAALKALDHHIADHEC